MMQSQEGGPSPSESARYQRIEWLAQRLNISMQSAYALVRKGLVGGIMRLSKRRILIDVLKFEEWAAAATSSPVAI
jgi:hypothetical protein